MDLRLFPFLLLAIGSFTSASAQVPVIAGNTAPPSSEMHVEAIVNLLVGVMDTSAQAAIDPDRVSVQMTTCRVELASSSEASLGVYLYQEQALVERLDAPYRQRFLHIIANGEDEVVESRTFKPIEMEAWIGLCDRASADRVIPATAFSSETICTISLHPTFAGYIGNTPPEGCPISFRGAVRLTNTIFLRSEGMDTWDRGFDAVGNQVWGAGDKPYEFRRRDRERG